jgi:hypothetical protein
MRMSMDRLGQMELAASGAATFAKVNVLGRASGRVAKNSRNLSRKIPL